MLQRTLLAVLGLGLAAALASCAPATLADNTPTTIGGLPVGAPARPATPYQYPAVHDMPPDRPTEPLNEDAQLKLEKELRATRDRQEAQEGQSPDGKVKTGTAKKAAPVADKKAVPPAKKPPVDTKKQPDDVIVVPPAGAAAKP